MAKISRGEHVPSFDTRRLRKDGSEIEVSITISPLRDKQGRVVGAYKLARDISLSNQQKRELTQALEEKQRCCMECIIESKQSANRC